MVPLIVDTISTFPSTKALKMDLRIDAMKTILFIRNVEWVRENPVPSHSIEAAVDYVSKHHPFRGSAFPLVFPKLSSTDSVELLAGLADAVTVACTQIVTIPKGVSDATIRDLNETSVGNLAHLSLFAPSETKEYAAKLLQRWRELKRTTELTEGEHT